MRKITVALEDEVYIDLIDYVVTKSKRKGTRLSMSKSASELIAAALSNPPREEELELR